MVTGKCAAARRAFTGFLWPVRALGLLVALAWVMSLSVHAEKTAAATPAWYQGKLSGQARTVYGFGSADGAEDSDFYQYLYLRYGDLIYRHFDIYFSGKTHRDLDGTSTSQADDIYAGAEDVSASREDRIYEGYGDLHDQARQFQLRMGRQYVDVADSLHLDGVQWIGRENSMVGGRLFCGQPVSYYSSVSQDLAYGLSLVVRPWTQNWTRATYVRYDDDSEGVSDERYDLNMQQRWWDEFKTRARTSVLNNDFEMAGMDVSYVPIAGDLDCSVSFYQWGGTTGESTQYSPLSQILGDREPYTYTSFSVSKNVLSWLYIAPEIAMRSVDGGADDASNREYIHYALTLAFEPNRAWNASVAGEYWDVEGGDAFLGVTGDIRYRHRRIWEIALGTGYSHYEYEQYGDYAGTIDAGDVTYTGDGTTIESSPDSYSYYLRGKWNINRSFSVRLRGEIENDTDAQDVSSRIQTSVVYRF